MCEGKIEKKNILFIVPTLCGGGAEKTVANLSNYLTRYYNVFIVIFHDTEMKYKYSGTLLKLSNKENKGIFKKIFFLVKSIWMLGKIKKRYKIDYSVSFLTTADFLNVLSRRNGSRTIISIRNTDSVYTKNSIYKVMTRYSCKKCEHIVAISKHVKRDLVNNFNVDENKITVIYNPAISVTFGKTCLKVDEQFFENFVVVNIGRLTFQKGQWHLIRAFSKVIESCPNARLLILGTGGLKKYLSQLVSDYKLSEYVKMLGFVDNPYDYIERASCFVFSSQFEGLGNAILESLSFGTPVLSTDCIAGPREILAPKTPFDKKIKSEIEYAEYGVLVPTCDDNMYVSTDDLTSEENLMADAIISLCKNKKMLKQYEVQAKKRSKFFSVEKITSEWVNFLNSVERSKYK